MDEIKKEDEDEDDMVDEEDEDMSIKHELFPVFLKCLPPDQGCFFSTKTPLSWLICSTRKTLKALQKTHFWDVWRSASIHASSNFFRKYGFWSIIGRQFLRHARLSLWSRSPTGESPSNHAPKATFPEKSRTSVDDCAPPNVPRM